MRESVAENTGLDATSGGVFHRAEFEAIEAIRTVSVVYNASSLCRTRISVPMIPPVSCSFRHLTMLQILSLLKDSK